MQEKTRQTVCFSSSSSLQMFLFFLFSAGDLIYKSLMIDANSKAHGWTLKNFKAVSL